jgi:hypothetical protein
MVDVAVNLLYKIVVFFGCPPDGLWNTTPFLADSREDEFAVDLVVHPG